MSLEEKSTFIRLLRLVYDRILVTPMDKAGEASNTDPLEFTFILALEKHDPIARGPTVKAGVVWFLPFHFSPFFRKNLSIKIFPS
jgi:hypothetical protein